jgi:hypothetical protein
VRREHLMLDTPIAYGPRTGHAGLSRIKVSCEDTQAILGHLLRRPTRNHHDGSQS